MVGRGNQSVKHVSKGVQAMVTRNLRFAFNPASTSSAIQIPSGATFDLRGTSGQTIKKISWGASRFSNNAGNPQLSVISGVINLAFFSDIWENIGALSQANTSQIISPVPAFAPAPVSSRKEIIQFDYSKEYNFQYPECSTLMVWGGSIQTQSSIAVNVLDVIEVTIQIQY